MKTCGVCSAVAEDVVTCPSCGEASWAEPPTSNTEDEKPAKTKRSKAMPDDGEKGKA